MILIPKHAFSPELMGGAIKRLTVHNKFLYDGEKGTLSFMNETPLFRVQSTPGSLFSFDNNRYMYMYLLCVFHVHVVNFLYLQVYWS